jgi:hypothetical protein
MKKMLFRTAMLVFLSAFLLSCGNLTDKYPDAEITQTETGNTLIVTEEFSAVILTKEFMEAQSPWVAPVGGYWTPEVDQILDIESKLQEYLAQNNSAFNSGHAPNKEKLSTYSRQYYGIVTEEGSYIYGKFFCSNYSEDADWPNHVVAVKGGGDCFFGVWWEPDTKKFIAVGANARE